MKHLQLFENYSEFPIGTRVVSIMGIRTKGTIIQWFNWRDATDGTFSEPARDRYVAIQWDDNTKGFSYTDNLNKLDNNDKPLPMKISIEDPKEYNYGLGKLEIEWRDDKKEGGYIDFEDGNSDSFIIYNDGRIAFNQWYPEKRYDTLVDFIRIEKEVDKYD